VPLFGAVHLSLLAAVVAAAILLSLLCRRGRIPPREGIHLPDLPLQLCVVSFWTAVLAGITTRALLVEFPYFAGISEAGMALLTPDLVFPWPSYAASVCFFLAHGGVVLAVALLVGIFDAPGGANYMYLGASPGSASLLDSFGAWPAYLALAAVVALALFWLLWLPVRPRNAAQTARV
jgi:uncharacterized membrane protein YwaF